VLAGGLLATPSEALPAALVANVTQAAVAAPLAGTAGWAIRFAFAFLLTAATVSGLALRPGEAPPQVPTPTPATAAVPRVDRYGDPLPDGAIARIGTNRMVLYGNAAAFSPDGKLVAFGGENGQFRVWETSTGKPVLEHRLDPKRFCPVTELAFSPDSQRLAVSGYWHDSVLLWDVPSDRLLQTIPNTTPGQEKWSREYQGPTLAFLPDGQTLLIGGKEGSLVFWDVAARREITRISAGEKLVQALTVTRDARTALTAHFGGELHLWDLANRQHLRRLDNKASGPHTAVVAPDGKSFAVCSAPDEVEVRNLNSNAVLQRFVGQAAVGGVAYTPDAGTVWVAREGGDVTAWDANTGERRHALTCQGIQVPVLTPPLPPTEVPNARAWFGADGRRVVWNDSGSVRIWDLATDRESPVLAGHRGIVTWAGFAADKTTLITGGWGGTYGLWDAETGNERAPLRTVGGERPICGSLSGDRRRAVLVTDPISERGARPTEGRGFLWNPVGGQEPLPFIGKTDPINLHAIFSPDGRFVVGTEVNGRVCVYDAATRRLVRTFGGQFNGEFSEYVWTFLRDGTTLVTLAKGEVTLYDFPTGKLIRQLEKATPTGYAASVAVSPDGQFLATGHYCGNMPFGGNASDDLIVLWRIAAGRECGRFQTGQGIVDHLVYSPDGRLIASCGHRENAVRLWEVATGLERRRYVGHDGTITSIDFAPDGGRLATASWDRTALVWQVFDPGPPNPSDADLAVLWGDLAGNATTAHRAIGALLGAEKAVPFLVRQLPPATSIDQNRLAALIADLDSSRFAMREAAEKELSRMADLAAPALRRTLENKPSAELRQRAEKLLKALDGPITNAELLRQLRAVEVLEQIGTPAAREHLKGLVHGAAGATLSRAAAEALSRLSK
jgi:WD40 repeat protein